MSRIVIKLGGSFLVDPALRRMLLGQVADLHARGERIILVHGGGKQIASMLDRLGIESRFHDGLRITDEATRDVVQMVLAGKVGKDLAVELGTMGAPAVSIAGGDADCVSAERTAAADGSDIGYVGRVVGVDPTLIDVVSSAGMVPVLACLGIGAGDRTYYNINGDQMAAAVAGGVKAEELVFVTDVGSVLDGEGNSMEKLDRAGIASLLESGAAGGGMRPKLRACIEALDAGVRRIRIVGAAVENVLYRALVERETVGTVIIDG
ncbi:MAG: acetylglutamate kinase [Blastocatellales bacterium]|nr:acetylglutamate kinase [Blastocatellales bacterium]